MQGTVLARVCLFSECCTYRIVPISEAKSVAKRVTTQHDDEGEDDEAYSTCQTRQVNIGLVTLTNNQQDLSESCPEFGLAVPLYSEKIY